MSQRDRIHIVLFEPEIPPNTGNIARLCVGNDVPLHLVGRLGFKIDDKHLKRAGLDYWPSVDLHRHADYADFERWWSEQGFDPARIFGFSARAESVYTEIRFRPGDAILFGPESRGLPPEIVQRQLGRMFVIPMSSGKIRSLNLSTAVGIVAYEAFRQFAAESHSR
jgi:tRNA (cytidine/uridine-2'-O-)-methyltransferase